MQAHFVRPLWLLVLLLLPAGYLIYAYGDRKRRLTLARWTTSRAAGRPMLLRALQAAAVAAIALALAEPAWRSGTATTQPRGSADIVFLLDVSRSMLAADVAPNRLALAKGIIRDLADQDRGNRVALLAFAGGQSIECPLTVDHAFFIEALREASPASVPRGGTRIGEAIQFALDRVFDDVQRDRRTMVVVSDGEDHGGAVEMAVAEARRAKIHVVSIGIGEDAGALVPVSATDSAPFLYHGAPVRSRLDAAALRSVADGGMYAEAGSARLDAVAIYRRWLAPAGHGSAAMEGAGIAWTVLLTLSIVLLAVEPRIRMTQATSAALAMILVLHPYAANAQTVDEWFGRGLDALEKHQYQDAVRYFGDAARWAPESPEVRFNLSKTLYELHSYPEAALSFEHAAKLAKERHLKAQSYLGQGNSLYRTATERPVVPERSIPDLRAAIQAYHSALSAEPGLFAADINLKVAERKLREYLQQFQNRSRPEPDGPGRLPAPRPPAKAEDILRESRRTQAIQSLAKPGSVDKDW
jgi:Ca-activated chloride channel family protein